MGCNYYVGDFRIPFRDKEKVESLLKECDLEEDFMFDPDTCMNCLLLSQINSYMAYSTAVDIDNFLSKLAEVINGTDHDGQIISYDYDGDKGYHIIAGGKCIQVDDAIVKSSKDVRVGEKYETLIKVEVIGLPEGKVAVIG